MVMIKPALPYLDIITRVRQEFPVPIAAYNVSGDTPWSKRPRKTAGSMKTRRSRILTSIQRAGADIILTYHAKDAARWLK